MSLKIIPNIIQAWRRVYGKYWYKRLLSRKLPTKILYRNKWVYSGCYWWNQKETLWNYWIFSHMACGAYINRINWLQSDFTKRETKMNQKALWNLSYGVYIVSVWTESVRQDVWSTVPCRLRRTCNGCNKCSSWQLYKRMHWKTGRFAITVLSEKTEPSIIELLDSRQAKKLTVWFCKYDLKNDMPIVKDGVLICLRSD